MKVEQYLMVLREKEKALLTATGNEKQFFRISCVGNGCIYTISPVSMVGTLQNFTFGIFVWSCLMNFSLLLYFHFLASFET